MTKTRETYDIDIPKAQIAANTNLPPLLGEDIAAGSPLDPQHLIQSAKDLMTLRRSTVKDDDFADLRAVFMRDCLIKAQHALLSVPFEGDFSKGPEWFVTAMKEALAPMKNDGEPAWFRPAMKKVLAPIEIMLAKEYNFVRGEGFDNEYVEVPTLCGKLPSELGFKKIECFSDLFDYDTQMLSGLIVAYGGVAPELSSDDHRRNMILKLIGAQDYYFD